MNYQGGSAGNMRVDVEVSLPQGYTTIQQEPCGSNQNPSQVRFLFSTSDPNEFLLDLKRQQHSSIGEEAVGAVPVMSSSSSEVLHPHPSFLPSLSPQQHNPTHNIGTILLEEGVEGLLIPSNCCVEPQFSGAVLISEHSNSSVVGDVNLHNLDSGRKHLHENIIVQQEKPVETPRQGSPRLKKMVFRCNTCDDPFDAVVRLRTHAKNCRHSKRYKCPLCDETFNQKTNLDIHCATHNAHIKITDDTLLCPICDKPFGRFASYRCHVTTVHQVDDSAVCEECNEEFPYYTQLKKHHRINHGDGEESVFPSTAYCVECGLVFPDTEELKKHRITHKKIRETIRSVSSKRRATRRKVRGEHKCTQCSKIFPKKSALERHVLVHTGDKPYKCKMCSKSFNQKGALVLHETTHAKEKPYSCQLCGLGFTQRGNLRKHVQRLHPSDLSNERLAFSCPFCPCIFRSVQPLNVHVSKRHNNETVSPTDENLYSDTLPIAIYTTGELDEEENGEISQQVEGSDLLAVALSQTGLNPISSTSIESSGNIADNEEMVVHQQESQQPPSPAPNPRPLQTEKSGQQLAVISQKLLKRATAELIRKKATISLGDGFVGSGLTGAKIKYRNGKKMWQCRECDIEVTRCSDLVRHMRRHTGERPYQCPMCHRAYSLKSTLNSHLRSHIGIKTDRCYICTKQLSNPSSLKRHLALHKAETLLCSQCGAPFKSAAKLNAHQAKHEKEREKAASEQNLRLCQPLKETQDGVLVTMPRPTLAQEPESRLDPDRMYQCSVCPAAYRHLRNLKYHESVVHNPHRSFYCCICHRSFLTARYLKEHVKRHNRYNPKPYPCSMCPKSFVSSGALRRHGVVHSDYCPFVCPYCDRRFKLGTHCRKHIRKSHADKSLPLPSTLVSTPQFEPQNYYREADPYQSFDPAYYYTNQYPCQPHPQAMQQGQHLKEGLNHNQQLPSMAVNPGDMGGCDISSVIGDVLAPDSILGSVGEADNLDYLASNMSEQDYGGEGGGEVGVVGEMVGGVGGGREGGLVGIVERDVWVSDQSPQPPFSKQMDTSFEAARSPPTFTNPMMEEQPNTVDGYQHQNPSLDISTYSLIDQQGSSDVSHQLASIPPAQRLKTCSICFKYFKKPSDFHRHLRIHTGEKPFLCTTCGRSFRVKSTLSSHMRTHTDEYLSYICQVCNGNFMSRSALKVHLRMHTNEKPFQCTICEEAFRTSHQRKRHWEKHHDSKRKKKDGEEKEGASGSSSAICPTAPTSNQLAKFVAAPTTLVAAAKSSFQSGNTGRHLVIGTENSAFRPVQHRSTPRQDGIGRVKSILEPNSQLCLSVFRDETGAFQVEVRSIPPGAPPLARDSDVVIEVNTLKELVKQGMLLNIPFSGQDVHSECHVTVDPYHLLQSIEAQTTDTTGTEYIAISELGEGSAREIEDARMPRDFYPSCEICEMNFSTAEESRAHFESEDHETAMLSAPLTQNQDRKWACALCNKAFHSRGKLQRHSAIHAPAKPYVCTHCSKLFSQKATLQAHIRAQHSHSFQPPLCNLCGKSFSSKSNVDRHMARIHGNPPNHLLDESVSTNQQQPETMLLSL